MSLQFSGIVEQIYAGGDTARARRWVAADYLDRVLLAAPSAPALFWPGSGPARPIPGLTDNDGWDGVEVFDDHVILWRGATLKWSARGDFGLWIPVALTAASGSALLESDLEMTATGSETAPAYFESLAGEFVPGQFLRIVSEEADATRVRYDYFRVRSVALAATLQSRSIKRAQTVAAGARARIYLTTYSTYLDWTPGVRVRVNGEATQLKVVACSRNANYVAQTASWPPGQGPTVPDIGESVVLNMERLLEEAVTGDVVSVGTSEQPGLDLYEVTTPASFAITLRRLGVGTPAGTTFPPSSFVSFQNWVEVENVGESDALVPGEATVSVVDAATLEPLGLTGGTDPGGTLPAGAAVESVDANESGEVLNVGSTINGPIYGVVALAEFAYILKQRSIQSIQSVGLGAGTFFIRPEILDEGPVGRYAWCRAGDREIAFIGRKGIYLYAGGQALRPVARQHWDTFRDEVDWARADEIVAHHNRRDSEVWFAYPTTTAETKVLVWNYLEDSVVIDKYPASGGSITALGQVDWELAPTWESLDISEKGDSAEKRWYEYVEEAEREYAIIGMSGVPGAAVLGEDPTEDYPRLYVHGRVWSRVVSDDCVPTAIPATAETPDFDFGDSKVWKYVDTVYVVLNGREDAAPGATVRVYIGARDNLNSPIRWSAAQVLPVTAAGSAPTKINAPMSGRYIRLRFESDFVGAKWGVSAYHIIARPGASH
jgi:hypothetical protein